MKLGTITKQPAERFSYTITYEEALTAGDNVESAQATVTPAGLTVDTVTVLDPMVKFWVSGGTAGISYKLTLTVTTADGRIFQDELTYKIKEV